MKAKLGLLGSVAALAVAGSIAATPAAAGDWFKREAAGSIKDAPVADTGRKLEWSVNGGLMSDYVFRGFSQNDEDPAWFVGADVTYGIAYAGIWAAQVDQFFTASDAEYDIYGGITPKLGPVTFDFGVIYYGYANQDKSFATGSGGVKVDYWEFKGGASTEINKFTIGATYYYSPDYTFELVFHTPSKVRWVIRCQRSGSSIRPSMVPSVTTMLINLAITPTGTPVSASLLKS